MPFAGNCPDTNCPPADAEEASGDVFRFVKSSPPTANDMRTWADDEKPADDPCMACALSVLRRPEDVATARKAVPFFRKRLVAKATLSATHGRIKQTGKHKFHFSFWVEAMHIAAIHEQFTVVTP
jgi:hypothetical protein